MRHGQRLEDGRLIVDNTLLAAEARCQTAVTIRHEYEQATIDESVTLVSGQAIHKAFEVFFKGGSAVDALDTFEQFYKPYWELAVRTAEVVVLLGGDEKAANDRRSYENVRRVLHQWFATHPREVIPFQADAASVEASFVVPLVPAADIWYSGTPDIGRATLADGSTWAVDHKSTGRMTADWRRGFRTSGQVSGYLWGLTQVHHVAYTGMFINAIEVVKVPSSGRKCTDHGVPYAECGTLHCLSDCFPVQRTPEELARWRFNAELLAMRYAARLTAHRNAPALTLPQALAHTPQEGKLTGACPYCPNYDFCGSGQSPLVLESRYVTKVWDPEHRDGAEEEGEA